MVEQPAQSHTQSSQTLFPPVVSSASTVVAAAAFVSLNSPVEAVVRSANVLKIGPSEGEQCIAF